MMSSVLANTKKPAPISEQPKSKNCKITIIRFQVLSVAIKPALAQSLSLAPRQSPANEITAEDVVCILSVSERELKDSFDHNLPGSLCQLTVELSRHLYQYGDSLQLHEHLCQYRRQHHHSTCRRRSRSSSLGGQKCCWS